MHEESVIGRNYSVSVTVDVDLSKPASSDDLKDTVDYVHINHIVKEEMDIRSQLLEHVAKRIIDRIFNEMPSVTKAEIAVSKLNPPIGGDVEAVTIVLSESK